MIFDNLKLILVHVPRTGGTSVEKALCDIASLNTDQLSATMPPNDLIKIVGEDKWNSYHKFTIVRNPYDRLVSTFLFSKMYPHYNKDDFINNRVLDSGATPQMFSTYVSQVHQHVATKDRLLDLQINWLTSGGFFANHPAITKSHPAGQLIVDRVLRFETLEADFSKMLQDLGLPAHQLPRLNASIRKPYQYYYGSQEIAWVGQHYDPDIRAFQYVFQPASA